MDTQSKQNARKKTTDFSATETSVGKKETIALKERADAGSAEDQFLTGLSFEKGDVIEKSLEQAKCYYEMSASQGTSKALYKLGI